VRRYVAAGLLMALALMSPVAAAKKHPSTADWQPYANHKGEITDAVDGNRVTYRNENVTIQIELLDDAHRRMFLESAGITTGDPFSAQSIGWRTFTFLIRVTNTSEKDLEFRPQSFFFITRKPLSNSTSCDFTCLIAAGDRAKLKKDESKRLLRAVMDSSETLAAGEKLSKLLVYSRMPDEFRDFVLDLDGFSVEGEIFRIIVPYAVPKPEKHPPGEK
jgi:hypothetical protein